MTKQHDARRHEIIQTAQTLFFTHGYDTCTVADIIDAVGIAKGTFYHYFKSKEDLLAELVETLSDAIIAEIQPIAGDTTRSALERLEEYFKHSMILKARSKEVLIPALFTLYRPENVLLRVQMIQRANQRVAPVLGAIIREGVEHGEFDVADPEMCGEFVIRSFSELSSRWAQLVLKDPDAPDLQESLNRMLDFMEWSLARLLGVSEGSVTLTDRDAVQSLFGAVSSAREETT